MADVKTVLNDPKFQGLPLGEKKKVLIAVDSNFAGLPDQEQNKVMSALGVGVLPEEHPFAEEASRFYTPALEAGGAAGGAALTSPGIATTLAGGALGYAAGRSAAKRIDEALGIGDAPKTVGDAAGEVVEGVAEGTVAEMAGGAMMGVAKEMALPAVKSAINLAKEAKKYGVRLTPAELLKWKPASLFEALLEKMPLSSGMIQRFRGQQGKVLDDAANSLVEKLGTNLSGQGSGVGIQKAIQKTHFERLKLRDAMFDKLTQSVPENSAVPLPTLGKKAQELLANENQLLEGLEDKKLAYFLLKLSNPEAKMSFAGAKLQRERLNALIGPVADTPEKLMYKRLKTALDEDINTWATSQGGKIEQLFRRANEFHGAIKQLSEDPNIKKIVKANPEDVVNTIFQPGNAGSVSELQLLRKATSPEDWPLVQKSIVRRLFEGTPGESPAISFAKNMRRYGENTLNAALSPSTVEQLKGFANLVNSSAGRSVERMAGNPSGTAQTLISVGQGGLLFTDPVKGAAALVAPPTLARIYLSKTGQKLITEGFSISPTSARAVGVAAAISKLIAEEQGIATAPLIDPVNLSNRKATELPKPYETYRDRIKGTE